MPWYVSMDRLGQAHRSCRCNLQASHHHAACLPRTTTSPDKPISVFCFASLADQISSTSYKLLHDSLCLARPKKGPLRSPSPTQSAARQFHGVQTTRTLAHQ